MSRAAIELAAAPTSPCPHCGRETKTTSDGICAECWGSKGGHPMGWEKNAPGRGYGGGGDGLWFFFLPGSWFGWIDGPW
jgi:hypothetical protein